MAIFRTKRPIKIIVLLLLVAAIVGAILYSSHSSSPTSQNLAAKNKKPVVQAATSKPQSKKTSGSQSQPNLNPGGTVDHNGQVSGGLPPASSWVSSTSGNITLQQPSPKSTVANGDTISGTAKVSNVTFILKDDAVGLIDQGNLNVVNGKFSGLMEFKAHSGSGKLEVYYPNPTNGRAEDIIEINVNFNE